MCVTVGSTALTETGISAILTDDCCFLRVGCDTQGQAELQETEKQGRLGDSEVTHDPTGHPVSLFICKLRL